MPCHETGVPYNAVPRRVYYYWLVRTIIITYAYVFTLTNQQLSSEVRADLTQILLDLSNHMVYH